MNDDIHDIPDPQNWTVRGCPSLSKSPRPFGLPFLWYFATLAVAIMVGFWTYNLPLALFIVGGSLYFGVSISADDPHCGIELTMKSLDVPERAF